MILDNYRSLCQVLANYHHGAPIVLTNGCFDILHSGHVKLLKRCAGISYGINALNDRPPSIVIVAIDSDESVRALKGNERPINTFQDRAFIVNALKPVNYVVRMDSETLDYLIRFIKPTVYVKGAEYRDSLNPSNVETLQEVGCRIEYCTMEPNKSSTAYINHINNIIEKN